MQVKKVSDFTQGRVHNLELGLDRLNEKARSSEIRATEKDSLEEVIRYSLPPPPSPPPFFPPLPTHTRPGHLECEGPSLLHASLCTASYVLEPRGRRF